MDKQIKFKVTVDDFINFVEETLAVSLRSTSF